MYSEAKENSLDALQIIDLDGLSLQRLEEEALELKNTHYSFYLMNM